MVRAAMLRCFLHRLDRFIRQLDHLQQIHVSSSRHLVAGRNCTVSCDGPLLIVVFESVYLPKKNRFDEVLNQRTEGRHMLPYLYIFHSISPSRRV